MTILRDGLLSIPGAHSLHPFCKDSLRVSSRVLNLSIKTSWTVCPEQNWLISWLCWDTFLLYFAENPGLIIRNCVVLDGLVGKALLQPVHHLNFIEFKDDSTAGSTLNRAGYTGISRT